MTKQEIIEIIEEEIKWHENDNEYCEGISDEYKEGFLRGMKHILRLINAKEAEYIICH